MRTLSPVSLIIEALSFHVGESPHGQCRPTLDQLVDYTAGFVEIQIVGIMALVVLASDAFGRRAEMRDIVIGTVCGLFLCVASAFPPSETWMNVPPEPRRNKSVAALGGVSLTASVWRLRRLLAERRRERWSTESRDAATSRETIA